MDLLSWLIAGLLAVWAVLAARSAKRHGGCAGCSGQCAGCGKGCAGHSAGTAGPKRPR